ncbi:MAG: hypothetical protein ABFE13_11545 [Phycisphaerales bacterium]
MIYLVSADYCPSSWYEGEGGLAAMLEMTAKRGAVASTGHIGEAGKPNVTRIVYPDGFTIYYEPTR